MHSQTGRSSLETSFRKAMAGVCTPVSVVTAFDHGLPHGTTVSAFCSLSMVPPMVLVALDRNSDLLALVEQVGEFGVNVLGADQAELALAFARKGGLGKFSGIHWESDHGVPRIPDTAGFLACRATGLVAGGDHRILLGEVLAADSVTMPPLTYYARSFGTHTLLADVQAGPASVARVPASPAAIDPAAQYRRG